MSGRKRTGRNQTDSDVRCGTCKLWVFGQLSFCGWRVRPGDRKVSAAYAAGGEGHAMWATDGVGCPTWKQDRN